jgi:hypothetical protein
VSPNARDFLPISFRETLDLLASWEGRTVRVYSYGQLPGEPLSHTQTVMAGALGRLQMVDNAIDEGVDSVAGFSVGPTEPNGFYVSAGDFRQAQPLPERASVRIDFERGYAIQVDLVD